VCGSGTIIIVGYLTFVSLSRLLGSPKAIQSLKMSIQFANTLIKNTSTVFNMKEKLK